MIEPTTAVLFLIGLCAWWMRRKPHDLNGDGIVEQWELDLIERQKATHEANKDEA